MPQEQPTALRTEERKQTTRPAYIYFVDYEGLHYYFTNYDVDITISNAPAGKFAASPQVFTAGQIAHSRPAQSLEQEPVRVSVILTSIDQELRKWFLTVPTKIINVEIFRINSTLLP